MSNFNRQDNKLGTLLIDLGYINVTILNKILAIQKNHLDGKDISDLLDQISPPNALDKSKIKNLNPSLGALLVKLGYLDQNHLDNVLQFQLNTHQLDNDNTTTEDDVKKNTTTEKPVEAKNIKFFLFKNVYISLGFIVSILAACISGSYGYFTYIHGNKDKLVLQDERIKVLEKNTNTLKGIIDNQKLKIYKYSSLLNEENSKLPKPMSFQINKSIIKSPITGNKPMVLFEWVINQNKSAEQNNSNYLIIKNIKTSKEKITEINPLSEKKAVSLPKPFYGKFSWLIRQSAFPGSKESEEIKFKVYESTLNRIIKTKKIIVATTKAVNLGTSALEKNTFEGTLLNKIIEKLKLKLKMNKITIDQRIYKWQNLLNSVKYGTVDIAIGGITASFEREKNYSPLKFTSQYRENHQIFITANGTEVENFPAGLQGATVAINAGSTNMRAAVEVLAEKYGFNIHAVPSFQDAYSALHEGKNINFALIDSEYFKIYESEYNNSQYGPELDDDLKDFYTTLNGSDSEYFAIAVHEQTPRESDEKSLLKYLNEIINKDDVKKFLAQQEQITSYIKSSINF